MRKENYIRRLNIRNGSSAIVADQLSDEPVKYYNVLKELLLVWKVQINCKNGCIYTLKIETLDWSEYKIGVVYLIWGLKKFG